MRDRWFVRLCLCLLASALGAGIATAASAQAVPLGGQFDPANLVNSNDKRPAVAVDASGAFVIVWDGGSAGDDVGYYGRTSIQGRRYAADGSALGEQFQVNTYTTWTQYFPDVAIDDDGDFVVVWQSRASAYYGGVTRVAGRRYNASGVAQGGEFQVNVSPTVVAQAPAVAMDADGDFVVTWASQNVGTDTSNSVLLARRFDAVGNPLGGDFQVNTYTTSSQSRPSVGMDAAGGFVIAWESGGSSGGDTSQGSVQGRRFDAAGAPLASEFQVNTYTTDNQLYPSIAVQPSGAFVVSWDSFGGAGTDTALVSVQGRRFDATGAPLASEFQVNAFTTDAQRQPSVAIEPTGSFVIAWHDSGGAGGDVDGGIRVRQFDASGSPVGSEFTANATLPQNQNSADVGLAPSGDFVVAWDIASAFGDVLARRFGSGGPTTTSTTTTTTSTTTTTTTLGGGYGCAASPQLLCDAVEQAGLKISEKSAGKEKVKLQWKKIVGATTQGDFGDPIDADTAAAVCIYDDGDALVQAYVVARAGQTCGGKPCWQAKGTSGYSYKDKAATSDGITGVAFAASSAGKGKASAAGKNNAKKGQTALPTGVVAALTGSVAPTMQLVTSDDYCVGATLTEIKKDDGVQYQAKK